MAQRTFEEAVKITVDWWIEKSFNTPLNQNNGDNSEMGGMAFMLMNMLSSKAQEDNTSDKVEKFRKELTNVLMEGKGKGRYATQLDVDYGPNHLLSKACSLSGVNSGCLPCKTFTFINEENMVEGRYQYGGEWFKL